LLLAFEGKVVPDLLHYASINIKSTLPDIIGYTAELYH